LAAETSMQNKSRSPKQTNPLLIILLKKLLFGMVILYVIIYLSHLGIDMSQGTPLKSASVDAFSKSIESLANIFSGELGTTRAATNTLRPRPVIDVLKEGLSKSLGLLGASLFFASFIGVFLGLVAAIWRRGKASLPILLVTITGISLPSFLIALLFQMLVIKTSQFTGTRILPVGGFGWDERLVLPALVLAARPLAQITRVTFVTVRNILTKDYVRTAYSKGVRGRQVVIQHVLKNALISILTTIGISMRFSLSSLPVVETFFGWGGIGYLLLGAISQQDEKLTVALVVSLGIIFILVNILLDLIYPLIDPRLQIPPDHISSRSRTPLFSWLSGFFTDLKQNFLNFQFVQNFIRRKEKRASISVKPEESPQDAADYRKREVLLWVRGTIFNVSFTIGGVLVLMVVLAFLFGTQMSPRSPYTTIGTTYVDGEFIVPPFAPGEEFPWGTDMLGRDLMSLILVGTQQTMVLATMVVFARLVVGFIAGALAGWFNGSWLDRFLLGTVETISAFPTLLLSMTLILALGIREGMPPFVFTLCFVGWGEIMQFIRAEVLSIRPKLFIESAVAVGQRSSRILVKHVLPNLIPALISIIALEMGAVLMILGELGFIGIFIGGGAFAQFEMFRPFFHYSDVPEWGALLSNIRLYSRSYPWTALYPSLAFFISILGFNLFGEGIRRLIDTVGVRITKVFNVYTFTAVTLFFAGFFYIKGSTGSIAIYKRQASQFQGQSAYNYLEDLTGEELSGRSISNGGIDLTADYIAAQFRALGVQPAGEQLSYFQTVYREYIELEDFPTLSISNISEPLKYKQDFMEYSNGIPIDDVDVSGKIRVVILREANRAGYTTPVLDRLNYGDDILLVLSERENFYMRYVPHGAVLIVTDDTEDFNLLQTPLPLLSINYSNLQFSRASGPPTYRISTSVAEQILEGTGYSIADLREIEENQEPDTVFEVLTDVDANLSIKSEHHKRVPVRHVLGFIPGTAAISGITKLDNELIVITAKYDTPAVNFGQSPSQFALDNASGVAMMLETIRTMKESGFQPYRTIYFVAYTSEGLEGGAEFVPEISQFLKARLGFTEAYDPIAMIELRGIGSDKNDGVILRPGSSLRLTQLFEKAADQMGIESVRQREELNLGIIFSQPANLSFSNIGEEAPGLGFTTGGWEQYSHLPDDTLEHVSVQNLENAGKVFSLAIMIMSREIEY